MFNHNFRFSGFFHNSNYGFLTKKNQDQSFFLAVLLIRNLKIIPNNPLSLLLTVPIKQRFRPGYQAVNTLAKRPKVIITRHTIGREFDALEG